MNEICEYCAKKGLTNCEKLTKQEYTGGAGNCVAEAHLLKAGLLFLDQAIKNLKLLDDTATDQQAFGVLRRAFGLKMAQMKAKFLGGSIKETGPHQSTQIEAPSPWIDLPDPESLYPQVVTPEEIFSHRPQFNATASDDDSFSFISRNPSIEELEVMSNAATDGSPPADTMDMETWATQTEDTYSDILETDMT